MKKISLKALLIPAAIGMMFACSEAKTDVKSLDGKWNIIEVKGEKVEAESVPNMEFNMAENKLHGNAGCNLFNTSVTVDDKDISALKIGMAATTMMACPDMELESKVLQGLDLVRSVKAGANENEMQLLDADGNVVFVLSK